MLHLQGRGDLRALISLVEAWSDAGEPTPMARLAQARALVQVGLVDRAWARISGLVEDEGASAEALTLTAELFLTKDWPKRAREILNRGLGKYPDDARLKALWQRLSEPQTTPDLDAVDDANADVASLITAAHHLIAAGSHTRARSLLDRARKLGGGSGERIDDMLWALDGDFSVSGSLGELVDRFGPGLLSLSDLDDEPEHTESVDAADLPPDERDKQGSFPNLFRDLEPRTEMLDDHQRFDDPSDEVTKISSMLDVGSLDTLSDGTFTAEHTEIQRVISHKALFEDSESETAFDLGSLQSDLANPESEDDDLVVVTRREEDTDSGLESLSSDLVLDDESPEPAPGRQQPDEDASWVLPLKEGSDEVPESDKPEPTRAEARKAGAKNAGVKKAGARKAGAKKAEPVKTEPQRTDTPTPPRSSGSGTSPFWLAAVAGLFLLTSGALLLLFALQLVTG